MHFNSTRQMSQASALPGLSHIIVLIWNRVKGWVEDETESCVELKRDISMNLYFKRARKKSLQENEGHLILVPYCPKHRNKCLYALLSFPTDCIRTHWPQHPDKPALSWNPNTSMWLKPKHCLKKYDDTYSQLQML